MGSPAWDLCSGNFLEGWIFMGTLRVYIGSVVSTEIPSQSIPRGAWPWPRESFHP